ncbi:MAG: phage terminase large subunit [Acinetobacter sp.]|uniref:phage terminase large subunit n=1 Tax=Acinetobacter sp. TaxID=472 RepID=UPI003CFDDD21
MNKQKIELNPFQEKLMSIPENYDIFLGGGRGGGKSYGIVLACLRHIEIYKEKARILFLRKTYKGLADFELNCREIFGMIYGTAAKYNQGEHVWRFPNGAYLELGQLETYADYSKYQGRSFNLLIVDEAGQYSDPGLLDMMRSNLRGSRDIPIRMMIAANPGGVGHHWLAKRYVFNGNTPWLPFFEEKSQRQWIYAPSTFTDNTCIDQEQYLQQLKSSCPDDPELLKAWTDGDWAVNRGAYFASVLEEKRNRVESWNMIPETWRTWLAHDFGSSAPSATLVMCESDGSIAPDGYYYPRGSIVVVDELVTNKAGNLNLGLGWTVPVLAEEIKKMCQYWDIKAQGVADDACFAHVRGHASASIADEFRADGVTFNPAKKADRISGWQRLKKLLANAGKPDKAGLYISTRCKYLWETLPILERDQRRVEDMDSTGPDHAADALRYGLNAVNFKAGQVRLEGLL